jgi:hypothetical protein
MDQPRAEAGPLPLAASSHTLPPLFLAPIETFFSVAMRKKKVVRARVQNVSLGRRVRQRIVTRRFYFFFLSSLIL